MDKKALFAGYGAEFEGQKVVLYRGANVPGEVIRNLRYGDYLSASRDGSDATGNDGASAYGKNVERFVLDLADVEVTGAGEFRFVGASKSLEGGMKYPIEIYKAYCDYHGHQFSVADVDGETDVRACASQALSGGTDEFDALLANFRFAKTRDSSVLAALENARDFIDDNLQHAQAQQLGFVGLLGTLDGALKGSKTYESLLRVHDVLVDIGAGPINDLRVAKSRLLHPDKTPGEVRRADPAYEIWRVDGKLDSAYFTRHHMRDALDVHCDAARPLAAFGVDRHAGRLFVSFAGETELMKRGLDQAKFFAQTPACVAVLADVQPDENAERFARRNGWDQDGESIFRPAPGREGELQVVKSWEAASALSRGEKSVQLVKEELLAIWMGSEPSAKSPYGLYGNPPMWRTAVDGDLVLFSRPGKVMERVQFGGYAETDGVHYQWQRDGKWVGQGCQATFSDFIERGPAKVDVGFARPARQENESPRLSLEQRLALDRFREAHGRNWKSKLSSLWSSGKDESYPQDGALLRQVRNDFGPEWLASAKLGPVMRSAKADTPGIEM